MSFKSGMELKIRGVPKPNPVRFTIDVGRAENDVALHFDFRFNYYGERRTIVMNSNEHDCWKEEQREKNFPFEAGQEFEITISFTNQKFYINLHNGKMIEFPNRMGDNHYEYLSMVGDVMVNRIIMK